MTLASTDQTAFLELPEGLNSLLDFMVEQGASDLHLSTDTPPALRCNGEIVRIKGMPSLTPDWMDRERAVLANDHDLGEYLARKSVDFGISRNGQRFRVNMFRHQGGDALAIRHLGSDFSSLAALNLPEEVSQFTRYQNGLVLICGATGSGKSTTLASLINSINRSSARHILTIEDPVEYVHMDIGCIVRQRELHTDAEDFASAIRASLREDPDVILVGEMRDVETMRAALTAAETGHVVFSTLHTGDVVGAIRRMIGAFPANEQDAVRLRISQSLRAVMAQHLLPTRRLDGRIPAVELMFLTTAIRHLISSNKLDQLYSSVETGRAVGMRTLEQSLADLVLNGRISEETAYGYCQDADALERLMR
ncbi:MAG: PilT/PilU family type 4a pilus ATPase [Pseudomonadota bacterium]